MRVRACQFNVTFILHLRFSISQYLNLSGGCIAVPVMERVTGLGTAEVSELLPDGVLSLALSGITFRWWRFLLICPPGVLTLYDLGVLA